MKWTPAIEADDVALFHVRVDGVSPFAELGMGVDLEEHEVVIAMAAAERRENGMRLRSKGKERVA